jgi:hypothetical protein
MRRQTLEMGHGCFLSSSCLPYVTIGDLYELTERRVRREENFKPFGGSVLCRHLGAATGVSSIRSAR